ncbi:hypothetical protein, partial [Spongiactinospora gelatinilytica]|uniref:hypothetical protein n=1 Tax=Spongiactinospora gelatinilytica TaxID=2666298 RepID=UPI001F1D6526
MTAHLDYDTPPNVRLIGGEMLLWSDTHPNNPDHPDRSDPRDPPGHRDGSDRLGQEEHPDLLGRYRSG